MHTPKYITNYSFFPSMFQAIRDCGGLSDPTNGQVTVNPNTLENSTATYSCDIGYDLVGAETRTCQSKTGMWDGTEPTCQSTYRQLIIKRMHKYVIFKSNFSCRLWISSNYLKWRQDFQIYYLPRRSNLQLCRWIPACCQHSLCNKSVSSKFNLVWGTPSV